MELVWEGAERGRGAAVAVIRPWQTVMGCKTLRQSYILSLSDTLSSHSGHKADTSQLQGGNPVQNNTTTHWTIT